MLLAVAAQDACRHVIMALGLVLLLARNIRTQRDQLQRWLRLGVLDELEVSGQCIRIRLAGVSTPLSSDASDTKAKSSSFGTYDSTCGAAADQPGTRISAPLAVPSSWLPPHSWGRLQSGTLPCLAGCRSSSP